MMSNAEVANVAKEANSLQKVNFFRGPTACSSVMMMILVVPMELASSKVVKAKACKKN